MRIHQLIDEIKNHHQAIRKSAQEIHRILDNNKKLFSQHIDSSTTESYIKLFSELADVNVDEYNSDNYKRQFDQNFNSLNYQLDRII